MKRKKYSVYFTDDEYEAIKELANRVAPGRTIGSVVRTCAISVVANPDLDFIFDPGVCLKIEPEELILRQKLFQKVMSNLELLKAHGIELPSTLIGGDENGSKSKTS